MAGPIAPNKAARSPRRYRAAALVATGVLGAVLLGAWGGQMVDPVMKATPQSAFAGAALARTGQARGVQPAEPYYGSAVPPDSYPPTWAQDPAPAPPEAVPTDGEYVLPRPSRQRAVLAAPAPDTDDPAIPHYAALEAAGTGEAAPATAP